MNTRIYLIGFMGSGKTTSGKQIARMMGYDFLDLDAWISEKEGLSVPEIFEKLGENQFRNLETEAIKSLSTKEKLVISTGGGTPCYNNNMKLLNELGLTVYLKLPPAALLSRLTQSTNERPLLANKTKEEMLITITELLEIREVFYGQAAMIIDGIERINERVVNAIQRRKTPLKKEI